MKIYQLKEILQRHPADEGSLRTQIARITIELYDLTEHLRRHSDDLTAKRGLLRRLADRRKKLTRLKQLSPEEYEEVVAVIVEGIGTANGNT